jgi:uncharacterized membrane protein YccC
MTSTPAVPARPAVAWSWSGALLGALCALPAAAVALNDVPNGLAFAVGVLPAVVVGVQPTRRQRPRVTIIGALAGASIVLGSLLAHEPWLAVGGVFVLALAAAELARHRSIGQLVLTLALPLVGVGLSYTDLDEAAGLALIMTIGSAYAGLVSMAWPERPAQPRPPNVPIGRDYGLRLGLAAAIAAAIGFALDLDHVGWACAAALLVMRPSAEMTQLRSIGRLAAVTAGAIIAALLANQTTSPEVYAIATVIALAGAAATRGSRWYVTPGFSTFFALSLLIYNDPSQSASRLNERVLETALGVALAYVFGLAIPAMRKQHHTTAS